VIDNLEKLLRVYERDLIALLHLVNLLIENTVAMPDEATVARLPAAAVTAIREKASEPPLTHWVPLAIRHYLPGTPQEAIEAADKAEMERWLNGLARWRQYFGFTAEPRT
jgi:hypothetical protein